MTRTKLPPMTREEAERRAPEGTTASGSAWGQWMRTNVRREIAAGRLRETNDNGERVTIH